MSATKKIWTIGHSTRNIENFIEMLKSFSIKTLVDVRSLPGSNKFPQFNQEELKKSLADVNIQYKYMKLLGGRRKTSPDSKNKIWKNKSFRGYADYMETTAFKKALQELKKIALKENTAIMCAEAVWWRCHRSMIADALKAESWKVFHIMEVEKSTLHPYTKPAKIKNGHLFYGNAEEQN